MRPLSWTSITAYEECPLKWKLQYVEKRAPKPRSYFSFGASLHAALEFLADYVPPPAPLDALLEFYYLNWERGGYATADEERRHFEYGRQLLAEFHRLHAPGWVPPLAVEHRFYGEVGGVPVTGAVDRIDRLPEGALEILDYKTGRNAITTHDAEASDQLTLYQPFVEDDFGMPVGRLTLYHLRTQTAVPSARRDEGRIDRVRERVLDAADGIREGAFEPRLGPGCPCEFADACPFFREPEPTKAPVEIGGLVEAYARVKEEERRVRAELERLQATIVAFLDEARVRRAQGPDHVVTLSRASRREYDLEAVRRLLEREGLLDRVLDVDPAAVKALEADPAVPREVRDAVRRYAREKAWFTLRVAKAGERDEDA